MTAPAPPSWLEVTLTLPEPLADPAGCALLEWGAPGLVEETDGAGVRLRAYLAEPPRGFGRRLRAYLAALGTASGVPGPVSVRLARRRDPGWARAWRAFHRPLRFGRVVVAASWHRVRPVRGQVLVRLDPGMAFGTGQHPTTAACLGALAAEVRPDRPLLDLGTGSGILAIAAARLGARPVIALDTDPEACGAAAANCRRNGVGSTVRVRCGSLEVLRPRAAFALILANLTAAAHLALLPALRGHLAPRGRAVLAGILAAQAPDVRRAVRATGLAVVGRQRIGEWVALHVARPS
ncbi:MAG: 50S ribosomal protein L11 methyltransferase [candidate division NC10 bacterium]|nr:50S ribosomal protein L11 methyltransferase [candidate division NC10 bacterium]